MTSLSAASGAPRPFTQSPRGTVVFVAVVVAVLFAALAVTSAASLPGGQRLVTGALAVVSVIVAATVAAAVVRGRIPDPRLAATLAGVVTLPVLNSLAHLAVTGQLRQTTLLMLTVVGIGAVVTDAWVAGTLVGATGAAWVAIVLAEQLGPVQEAQHYGFGLAMAALMAFGVHVVRSRAERALRHSHAELDAQVTQLTHAREALDESHARYRGVFAASPVGIGLADERGLFVEVNAALATMLGRSPSELIGHSSREFTHEADLPLHAAAQQMIEAADDGIVRVEKRYLHPDGDIVWAWLTITSVPGPQGEQWTLAHVQDVTERHRAEQALRHSKEDLAAVADVARCGQSGQDPRPVVVSAVRQLANAHFVALAEPDGDDLVVTACAGHDITGTRVSLSATAATVSAFTRSERVFVADAADSPLVNPALIELTSTRSMLAEPVRSDGVAVAVLVVGWTHPVANLQDREVSVVGTLADEAGAALTARVLRSQLQSLATTDPLTGLVNRRGWYDRLQLLTAQARRSGEPLTLAIADLDHFKAYNDTYGHEQGDQLLRAFADATVGMLREVDIVARWGGEEFAIALPGCDAESAIVVLDRLRLAVPGAQTCSFGIADWEPSETVTACLRRADEALYRAKAEGRNRIAS